MIAAIEDVDFVTSFDEPTAHGLLEALRPEVHVKGTDWSAEEVPERKVIEVHEHCAASVFIGIREVMSRNHPVIYSIL